MTQRPDCDCHGEPMWWHTDRRIKAGGSWRCSVRERERSRRRYWANPVVWNARKEGVNRNKRIARMEHELKELLDA